jgi:GTPase SAR1 family protein
MMQDDLYKLFLKNRDRLVEITRRHNNVILEALVMKEEQENISQLVTRLANEQFKLLIIGEFSRGKSTFINALLKAEEEILPTDILEATAVITEVKYGEQPEAIVHYKPDFIQDGKTTEAVDYAQLKELVTFQDGSSDEKAKQINDSPFEKLELFWPLDLCKNGVELIDSPGLNASAIGTQVTINYLNKVDAILFILSCTQLGSSTEMKTIETIRNYGFEDIFFVCNYFDAVRGKKDEEKVKGSAIKKLAPLTQRGEEDAGIFFISARDASEGYQEKNEDLVRISGISSLEQSLELFLSKDKGRSKLVSAERVLRGSINKARNLIPEREKMFNTSLIEFKERYEETQVNLNSMDLECEKISRKLTNFREDIKDLISIKGQHKIIDITNKIAGWLAEYEIKEPLKLASSDTFKMKAALERVISEITIYLSERVGAEFETWQKEEIEPLLKERLDLIVADLENNALQFIVEIDSIREGIIYGNETPKLDTNLQEAKISPLERILSAVGGFYIGGLTSAALGATFGYKEVIKSILPQIALAFATTLVVGTNPFVLVPVLLGGGFAQGLLKIKGMNEEIKKQVGDKYIEALSNSRQPDQMADAISIELRKMQDLVNKGFKQEIDSVRTQAQSILADKNKGDAEVQKQLLKLKAVVTELEVIDNDLNELMRDVIQM